MGTEVLSIYDEDNNKFIGFDRRLIGKILNGDNMQRKLQAVAAYSWKGW